MRTTDDMVALTRQALDEDETSDVSDAAIYRALNRAQMRLQRVAAKRCPDLFMDEVERSGVSGRTTAVPTDAYARTVNAVDAKTGSTYFEVKPAQLRQLVGEDTAASTSLPQFWALKGADVCLYPRASSSTIRIRYQRRLPQLVAPLALVESVTEGGGSTATRVYLDSVDSALTTSTAGFAAFVNVVNPNTGRVKGTYQVTAVGATYVELGAYTRTTAYEYTVLDGTQTAAELDDAAPEQDDWLCSAAGSCVPPLGPDAADYLVQGAVVELKRKVGEDAAAEYAHLKELEDDMASLWAGRPTSRRVSRVSPYWGTRSSLQSLYRD